MHDTSRSSSSLERTLSRATRALAAGAVLACSGCLQHLPPPEAPARELSGDLEMEALRASPPEGQGTVVLDVIDGPATVEALGDEPGAEATEVCQTPCVAHLALGEQRLLFRRGDRADEVTLTVRRSPSAHLRVMSYDSGHPREPVALAAIGLVLSTFLAPIMGPIARMDGNLTVADGSLIAAAAIGGVALVAGIVGVVLTIIDAQRVREGASAEWQLDPPVP